MSQRFQHTPSFDGLRCIAVLCVLVTHVSPKNFLQGGWIGVDLFFVLSGYLITSLLQNEYCASGKIAVAKFYTRRALRLFPPLLICLAMANMLWPCLPYYYFGATPLLATVASLFYFANLVPSRSLGLLQHVWSLSVEEHFYLVWPIILSAFLFYIPLGRRVFLLTVTVCFIEAFRIVVFHLKLTYGLLVIDSYTFTLCRMDAILMGSLLAMILSHGNIEGRADVSVEWALGLLFCLLTTVVLFVSESNIYWHNGGFIVTNLICLSIVAIAARNPNEFVLSNNILRWIGRRSYGIYLYHFPIFLALEALRRERSLVNYFLVTILRFAITIFVADVSYRFIERPVLRYKKRYQVASEFVLAQPPS